MNIKRYTLASMFIVFITHTMLAYGSSPVYEFWKKLVFITDSGNKVLMEMKGDHLNKIIVMISGVTIRFPPETYSSLKIPVLNRAVLISSSGIINGSTHTIYALEFPLMDADKDSQDWSEMKIVHYVIDHHRLVERDIWENSKRNKLISRKLYKLK